MKRFIARAAAAGVISMAFIAAAPATAHAVSQDCFKIVTAVDDSATTAQDTAVAVHVLTNDTSLCEQVKSVGDTVKANNEADLTVESVDPTSAHGGTDVIDPTSKFVTYTPKAGFSGVDTFDYQACDVNDDEECDNATVTVTVDPTPTTVQVLAAVVTTTTVAPALANTGPADVTPLLIAGGTALFSGAGITLGTRRRLRRRK